MPVFSEVAIWRAPPEIAAPVTPPEPSPTTPPGSLDIDGYAFHQLLASASKRYESLQAQSWRLEVENGRLQHQLAMLRPDAKPEALNPLVNGGFKQEGDTVKLDAKPEVFSARFNGEGQGEDNNSVSNSNEGKRVRISNLTIATKDLDRLDRKTSEASQPNSNREVSTKSVSPSEQSSQAAVGQGLSFFSASPTSQSRFGVGSSSSIMEPSSPTTPGASAGEVAWSATMSQGSATMSQEKSSKSLYSKTASEVQRSELKKHHELRRKFLRLDRDGSGRVESDCLEELMAKHQAQARSGRRISVSSISSLVTDNLPSCLEVIQAVSGYLGSEESVMTFETFVALMTKEELRYHVSPGIWEKILAIRAMFAREEMTKMVARFSHVATQDLSALEKDRTAWYLRYLDPVSLTAIFLNAIMIGVSSDIEADWTGWNVFEFLFTAFFTCELFIKVISGGCDRFLFGKEALWNWVDTVIVLIAVVDAVLNVMATTSDMQMFTMMRLVRLARITRLVRLLRFKFFKELLLMIRGVFAGMRTLLWAIVLLSLYIFMLGMLMRQTMGRWCDPDEWEEDREDRKFCTQPQLEQYGELLFSTLPRACLTVFRCLTDGCNAPDGTPLVIHIFEDSDLGPFIVLIYICSFLFVTFGLFNLIMAIFVENTMESAKFDERKRQRMRQMQAVHVAEKLQRLVIRFCKASVPVAATPSEIREQGFKGRIQAVREFIKGKSEDSEADLVPVGLDVEISRDTFSKVVADPSVEKLLDDLEVAVADPMDLFDTLDADGSGSIDAAELIKGLMKLRGTAEKSDVVACLLAVRAIQKSLTGFEVKIMQSNKNMIAGQDKVDSQIRLLDSCLQKAVPGYGAQLRALREDAAAKNKHGRERSLT